MARAWCTASEAVARIQSGQSVFLGSACGEPQTLVEALLHDAARLHGVALLTGLQGSRAPYVAKDYAGHFRLRAFMASPAAAEAIARGDADYLPVPLSRIPPLMRGGRLHVDVALVQVAPADSHGRFSLGVSVAYAKAAVAAVLSPEASASSTLRTKLRTRERRDLLTSVRRAILRVAFLAEEVLAMVPL